MTPSDRTDGHPPPELALDTSTRPVAATSSRTDRKLLAGGVLAIASAVATSSALSLPWIAGSLSEIGRHSNAQLLADLTFRASDSIAGALAVGVAVVTALLGLLWFWYATEGRSRLPAAASPVLAVLAGIVALAALTVSKFGTSIWYGAFIANAREAGLTKAAMRTALDERPAPLIELSPQSGMVRFAIAAALAVVAGLVARWSQRRRGAA